MSEGHDYLSKYLVPNSTMMNRARHRKKENIKYVGKFKIKTLNTRTDGKFSVEWILWVNWSQIDYAVLTIVLLIKQQTLLLPIIPAMFHF